MNEATKSGRSDLERLRIREDQRRPVRKQRRWPFVLIGIAAIVVVVAVLGRPREVQVAAVRAGGQTPAEAGGPILTANGYVEARHQTSVAARTTGRLAEVLVEEGDAVVKDQVVARLIDDDQRAALAQAEANLALARARLEQAKVNEVETRRRADRRVDLRRQNVASDEETEGAEASADGARAERMAAEATVQAAQAAVMTASLELAKTQITAPFDGVVLRKDAEMGEIVGPIMTSSTARAGAVVTIADLRTLEVGIDVNEIYIARLASGTPADVVLDAHPEVHFPGEILAIFPSADRDKATIPVRVRFLVDDERIRPDLGAKVTFMERRSFTDTQVVRKSLQIPAIAVRAQDGKSQVWVVREGKAEPAVIEIGETSGDQIEVKSGLNEGDQIVINGASGLRRGARVRVKA